MLQCCRYEAILNFFYIGLLRALQSQCIHPPVSFRGSWYDLRVDLRILVYVSLESKLSSLLHLIRTFWRGVELCGIPEWSRGSFVRALKKNMLSSTLEITWRAGVRAFSKSPEVLFSGFMCTGQEISRVPPRRSPLCAIWGELDPDFCRQIAVIV